jgi:small-conductance mechanosensitive channel
MSLSSVVDTVKGVARPDVVASVALLAAVLSTRLLAVRALGRSRLAPEVKAHWFHQIRTAALVSLLVGLLVIWTRELQELAFSLAAMAVAFVISLKELILCLHGSFLRTTSRAFSVGDRVQIAGCRGDVVETGALTTTLLEVSGPGSKQTGSSVVLPNSVLVDKPIVNESFAGDYGLFTLSVPAKVAGWAEAEERLLGAARTACVGHREGARRHIESVGWQKGLGPDSIDPSVSVELADAEKVVFQLRFPAPTRVRGQVEQDILRRYLAAAPAVSDPGPVSG